MPVRRLLPIVVARLAPALVALLLSASIAFAQQDAPPSPPTTLFSHPDDVRWWLSGQLNLIEQAHPAFTSPYEGDHSLRPTAEQALSRLWTIYTGWAFSQRTEVFFDVESAGGHGISDAVGLAGFTDLDVVRNPALGSAPYVARAMIRQVIPLSGEEVDVARGPFGLARREPKRRLEIRAGKMGLVDFFDQNSAGSDSHLQFTNWTVDNNGAYDYAADTRGYTYAVVAELISPGWTLRGAEALMPTVANGPNLDWHVSNSRSDNVELELRPRPGFVIRTLAYVNHANMGVYDEAIARYLDGIDPRPIIENTREPGRRKYGVGENLEYALGPVRLFSRLGWNNGVTESFAYTEVDNTVLGGGDVSGSTWARPLDRAGVALVSNGLSGPHREYLRLGGEGFLLGDGTLRYGRETILETYYTAHLWRGVFASAGAQFIANPGYNQDRGPVLVGMTRLHLDF